MAADLLLTMAAALSGAPHPKVARPIYFRRFFRGGFFALARAFFQSL
jgi:hypothetical protein